LTEDVLLYLTTEVDREVEADFNRWLEGHARDNLEVPGFLSARRLAKHAEYRGAGDAASYLTLYELSEAEVLTSDAYANRDSPMPAVFSGRYHFARSLFRALEPPSGEGTTRPRGRAVLHVTVDVEADYNDEFLQWYVEGHVPAVLSAPGMISARRYARIEGAADENPEGMEIRYLTLYEMEDPGVVSLPETLRASREGACPERLAPHRRANNHVYTEIFWADE